MCEKAEIMEELDRRDAPSRLERHLQTGILTVIGLLTLWTLQTVQENREGIITLNGVMEAMADRVQRNEKIAEEARALAISRSEKRFTSDDAKLLEERMLREIGRLERRLDAATHNHNGMAE